MLGSLPPDLQTRFNTSKTPRQLSLPLADQNDRELAWRLHYVAPLALLPPGSQLKAAIMELHNQKVPKWDGGTKTLKRKTLYDWVKRYKEQGLAGLLKVPRSDAGKAKVKVSRKFDNASQGYLDDAQRTALADALKLFIRGCWKAGEPVSKVQHLAQLFLREQARKLGFLPNDPDVFAIHRTRLNRERHYAKVYRHKFDRKASEDSRYRVRRDASGLRPMEVVVGDFHHMNTPLRMPSGRVVYPCIISFVDVATLRIFSVVVISEAGGSVRVVDMIDAYKAMLTDPSWGFPRTLYLDNGKENGFAPFMKDAVRLAWPDADGISRRTLIKALAHNPQAKAAAEGRFAHIENHYLKHMQGWAGDDRHNPKVPRLGRRHAPFGEGADAYFQQFYDWQHVDNTFPVAGGHLEGDSPEERFRKFVAGEIDGTPWRAVIADEAGFNMAFSERTRVQLRRQTFRLQNVGWTCDALQSHHRDYCFIYKPRYHKFNAVVVEDLDGNFLGIAEPEKPRAFLDPQGIQNSIAARKLFYDGLGELDRSSPNIDTAALLIGHARTQAPAAPNPPQGVVRVSSHTGSTLAFRPRSATAEDDAEAQEIKRRARYEAELNERVAIMRRIKGE